jgi:hypothetical protein
VRKPHDIVDIVENMQPAKDRNNVVLPTAYSLDKTDAVYAMARAALAYCDPVFQTTTEDVSKAERH